MLGEYLRSKIEEEQTQVAVPHNITRKVLVGSIPEQGLQVQSQVLL